MPKPEEASPLRSRQNLPISLLCTGIVTISQEGDRMKLSMSFKEYLKMLRGYCNVPLSLNRLTLPFGIISDAEESNTLLVGHVLEELSTRHKVDQAVDCIDVVAAAYELGHEKAEAFL